MYDHCNSQTTWSDHSIFDLTSSHFDSQLLHVTYILSWMVTPVLPFSCDKMTLLILSCLYDPLTETLWQYFCVMPTPSIK
jgi:hypothetical protein